MRASSGIHLLGFTYSEGAKTYDSSDEALA